MICVIIYRSPSYESHPINECVYYAKQFKCPVKGLLELSTKAYAILILPAVVTHDTNLCMV